MTQANPTDPDPREAKRVEETTTVSEPAPTKETVTETTETTVERES